MHGDTSRLVKNDSMTIFVKNLLLDLLDVYLSKFTILLTRQNRQILASHLDFVIYLDKVANLEPTFFFYLLSIDFYQSFSDCTINIRQTNLRIFFEPFPQKSVKPLVRRAIIYFYLHRDRCLQPKTCY